jgi:hypothetical protein
MSNRLALGLALLLLGGGAAFAQTGNPNPKNFRMILDGGETPGVTGFAIDFERNPELALNIRRVAAPSATPKLTLTLTPKGLNTLSGWLNDAGSGNDVAPRSVEIQSLDNEGNVLIDWRLDGVQPVAITQASNGAGLTPTASVIFAFEKLTLVKASSN